ncbi:hypothetical protein [Anoxynatronum sibiricum]|uniref:Uncharacterized protein n=1 Tax=Anoxynatronum sibiricum TaxID=210623 RepID=A0ABU9W036_9CLOT
MDAYRLDNTIQELESEVTKLKSINVLLEQMATLEESLNDLQVSEKKNMEAIEKAHQQNLTTLKDIKAFTASVHESVSVHQKSFEESTKKLMDENSKHSAVLGENLKSYFNEIDKKYDELARDYRKQYREYEVLVDSKIERLRSDLEVQLRDISKSLDEKLEMTSKKHEDQLENGMFMIQKSIEDFSKKLIILGVACTAVIGVVIFVLR